MPTLFRRILGQVCVTAGPFAQPSEVSTLCDGRLPGGGASWGNDASAGFTDPRRLPVYQPRTKVATHARERVTSLYSRGFPVEPMTAVSPPTVRPQRAASSCLTLHWEPSVKSTRTRSVPAIGTALMTTPPAGNVAVVISVLHPDTPSP